MDGDDQRFVREVRRDLDIRRLGMDHHRNVGVGKRASFEEDDLAATPLLGRRAEDGDASAECFRERRHRQPRPEPGRGDDVVTAAVADVGQCVVLATDDDMGPACPASTHERRVKAEGGRLNGDAMATQRRRELPGGKVLSVAKLRIGVNGVTDRKQLVGNVVDGSASHHFRRRCVHVVKVVHLRPITSGAADSFRQTATPTTTSAPHR